MSFVSLNSVSKHYGQGQGRVTALHRACLSMQSGEFLSVMGPSGSGKSTLLSVLGGLNTPDSGSYVVDDIDIYSLNSDQRADFRREYLGFVFQNFNLLPYLTLQENTMLPLATKRLDKKNKLELSARALERVGLGDKLGRLPSQISGGEQERTAVARALVNQPPLLLADEPTGNLDAKTSCEIMELLAKLNQEGMTILMVTHSLDCASHAQRIVQMQDGRIVGQENLQMVSSN